LKAALRWGAIACCLGVVAQPQVRHEANPGSDPAYLTVAGKYLYFTADDGATGREIWALDGEGMVAQQSDVPSGPDDRIPTHLTAFGDELAFVSDQLTTPPAAVNVLLTQTGRAASVALSSFQENSVISSVAAFDGYLYFINDTPAHGREIWVADPAKNSARLHSEFGPGTAHGLYPDARLTAWPGGLIVPAFVDGNTSKSVYWNIPRHDAAPAMFLAYGGPLGAGYDHQRVFDASRLFVSNWGLLWVQERSTGHATVLASSDHGLRGISQLALSRGRIFFNATTDAAGAELWTSDGTVAGTRLVKDIYPGVANGKPYYLAPLNDGVCFVGTDEAHGIEVWFSDGTESGTHLVKDMIAGPRSSEPYMLTEYNGHVYFSCYHDTYGEELWRTDGTEAGTELVADINPGAGSSEPYYFRVFNGALYFAASDGVNGFEVWRTRGTAATTEQVTWIRPPVSVIRSASPRELTVLGSYVYFSAETPGRGRELCVSDGTHYGTRLVFDQTPGPEGSNPRLLQVHEGALYYAIGSEEAPEWWLLREGSDVAVTAVGPPPGPPESLPGAEDAGVRYVPGSAFSMGDRYLLAGYTPEHGTEPWIYFPDEGRYELLQDLFAGPASSAPSDFTLNEGTVYFRANTGASGTELFVTTGEPGNVELVWDFLHVDESTVPYGATGPQDFVSALVRLPSGAYSGHGIITIGGYGIMGERQGAYDSPPWMRPYVQPNEFAVANGLAFFVCDTPWAGNELWVVEMGAMQSPMIRDLYPNDRPKP